MAFLTLNGLAIPVVRGGEEHPDPIGFEFKRTFSGAPITDARGYKRRWQFTTPPLSEQRALEIIGLVQGRGINLPFDADWDQYSTNGAYPTSPVWTQRNSYAADGTIVYDEAGAIEGNYTGDPHALSEDASAAVETGTTNVLYSIATDGDNIATGTDADAGVGGFTAVGTGTRATSTAAYWQGSRSLVVTSDAVDDGVRTSNATVAANATVTASVYVRVLGVGSVTPKIRLYQGAGFATLATSSTVTFLTTSEWRRITLTATLTGGNTLCAMGVLCPQDNGGAQVMYCDGFQIEELAYATSWVAGTRAAGAFAIPAANFPHWGDLTISGWFSQPSANPTVRSNLFLLYNSDTNYARIYREASTNNIIMDFGGNTVSYSTSVWTGAWRHIAMVVRLHPETGETGGTMYLNGTSAGTLATAAGWYESVLGSVLYVGNNQATQFFQNGRIDGLRVVPYAKTALGIAAEYAALAYQLGATPQVMLAGDVVAFGHRSGATATYGIPCLGQIDNVHFNAHQFGSAWRNNGRVIEFTLFEV